MVVIKNDFTPEDVEILYILNEEQLADLDEIFRARMFFSYKDVQLVLEEAEDYLMSVLYPVEGEEE